MRPDVFAEGIDEAPVDRAGAVPPVEVEALAGGSIETVEQRLAACGKIGRDQLARRDRICGGKIEQAECVGAGGVVVGVDG
ncbi:hypothetical protein ACCS68_24995, partial [Rhizobium beringeri]|uniref:hypothetical protein n=1 Tax=Rhizobium beringeri TaxID=3019934 RepID=UPI003F950A60